jgi:lipoate-protein ligase A
MDLLTQAHPSEPARDMATSAALLSQIAARAAKPSIRVYRPGATAAFGSLDRLRSGFLRATEAAIAAGLVPIMRVAGGHVACYDADSVIVEVFRPETTVVGGLEARFEDLAELLTDALTAIGVTVDVGQLPGEYCPGRFSVHLSDGPKIAGIAQRVIQGASLTSAVIVVAGGARLRAAIASIYAALEIPIDIDVAGAIDDREANLDATDVFIALPRACAARYALTPHPTLHAPCSSTWVAPSHRGREGS